MTGIQSSGLALSSQNLVGHALVGKEVRPFDNIEVLLWSLSYAFRHAVSWHLAIWHVHIDIMAHS